MNNQITGAGNLIPMTLGIMQSYFFPYLGYYQLIAASDKLVIYDNCQYIKQGWVNRNRLLKNNGEVTYITVPLKKHSHKALINEIQIYNDIDWRKKILATIKQNYSKANYFNEIYLLLQSILLQEYDTISHLNRVSISEICRILEIKTEIIFSSEKYAKVEEEIKSGNYDCKPMVKRVLSICEIEQANHYLNAIGGTELYSKELFYKNGVRLEFVKRDNISYPQLNEGFVPDLSIIDILMNVGAERTKMLLKEYRLV